MLEDQVAFLLQKYLGNYVRGLSKEALKISVWQGDVELTNMQLKPEALNALNLPVKVKAGFLGSVKLKVPWSRLGQDPVLVYLDRIFLIAQPATQVEGYSEDAVQEAKKTRVREMEMKLLETKQQLESEMNKSWLGSLVDTIIGNLKLSISNIHIRYEDSESNPGHTFAAGITLEKLSAVTINDDGREIFATGGALERIQKSVKLEQLAFYFDSDVRPWHLDKPWEDLLPMEWVQVFKFGTKDGKPADSLLKKHNYILQPVSGNAKYSKLRPNKSVSGNHSSQKAAVNLDDVTICLAKDGYRDILKLADNFAAFNQRLNYAHYRPLVSVKSNPLSWWKYAFRAISDQIKKASGNLSWEQVLRYARIRKRYISLYATLLKSEPNRAVIDDNKDIEEFDRELDTELILQWRMLAHKFVEQSIGIDRSMKKQNSTKSWWSLGWNNQSLKNENESLRFSEEDWKRLNNIIGYKEVDDEKSSVTHDKEDVIQTSLDIHMNHNASKLMDGVNNCLAELSCENLDCSVRLYTEAKIFDMKLGSYKLSSPNGLLAESATTYDSLVGVFSYKPFDANVDWSLVAKASPCYMTYLKDSIDQIIDFFKSNTTVSQTIALEAAAAVQMTIDGVVRTAQQQVNRALKDHTRFLLDLDIAAPKITIPTDFRPDNIHSTKLLLDLGNLVIHTQDNYELASPKEMDMYLQFDLVLSDVSAFLVDGDYRWSQKPLNKPDKKDGVTFLPVIDKCGIIVNFQQIRLENPSYPSTRLALRLPSLGFHFSPARYHRLMEVVKIFQEVDTEDSDYLRPWNQADFEGWLSLLCWKGVGNREAVWQRRYVCLVGPFVYVLESPGSKSYKQYFSLRGKQIHHIPVELVGNVEHVLAISDAARSNIKVVEDVNALILRCDTHDSKRIWQNRLQGAIYRASGSAPVTSLPETSSDSEDSETETETDVNKHDVINLSNVEKLFVAGVLDELKICFSYNNQHDQTLSKALLAEENRLFEFRAIGGQVELLMKGSDMFIGTVLKSLEIEDLVSYNRVSKPRYLARSFIGSMDASPFSDDASFSEGDDKFYEAPEDLVDPDCPTPSPKTLKAPSFSRIFGLLPDDALQSKMEDNALIESLDSFVKAQIVIYDQNSPLYNNLDKRVVVTLATLSFFIRRPTILAIMNFANAINIEEESREPASDTSSVAMGKDNIINEDMDDSQQLTTVEEPVVKGLLGKGKSRIIFNLTLNMVRAQILLMNENETKLATLSQDNLLADIKIYPSSFSIKAALGNLRISDDSLAIKHMYFWACDMRNPGGTSFVELVFTSYGVDDEDFKGYEYSLFGQLSEVRIVYLNRFVQEVINYFLGLVPNSLKGVVKLKDQVTNSEKWFTTSEIEGSPALKLDLSLRKPIIIMPRKTDSLEFLKLDVVHITVQNTCQWFGGSKNDLNAVHLDIMTVMVEDINLNVGMGTELGESIIHDVKGVSVVIRRSLRDLLHQIPNTEAAIKIDELKASLSNREYQIITECALSNFSEVPNTIAPLNLDSGTSSGDVIESPVPRRNNTVEDETISDESWISMKVSVAINLVELSLHSGIARDSSLATLQISGVWLLYKSNTLGDGFLSATLKGFTVIDDREGTAEEFRLAVGKHENTGYKDGQKCTGDTNMIKMNDEPIPTMLIIDAKFSQLLTSVSLCIQRPHLLVALDFLLAVVEFFVPTVGNMLSNEDDENFLNVDNAIILDNSTYNQPSAEISLSPRRPLIADDERFDLFIYDGRGGTLYLQDRQGFNLSFPSTEATIYIGSGKKLQFKNVFIKNGLYLDSCISLGTNSSYSVSESDHVYLEESDTDPPLKRSGESITGAPTPNFAADRSMEFVIELQAIGPELTFYNMSTDLESSVLSNRLLHAQLDAFCRLVVRGDTTEMSANALGLMMESNGNRILEPFDTHIKFSSASGKTNIHIAVSNIFMNFSFSILRLFLAVEEDILAFLRRTSQKRTTVCSQFDKVGMIKIPYSDQVYTFWRPKAPPGFAVLGDYLTPMDKPPTKGVLSVNMSFLKVKRPLSFKLIWPPVNTEADTGCSIWFPEAPKGYVAMGCIASPGKEKPPLSFSFCISAALVSPCALRDCITISCSDIYPSRLAFWRVDNSVGTFLPADDSTLSLTARAYELRHILLGLSEASPKASKNPDVKTLNSNRSQVIQPDRVGALNSGRRFEAVASFQLVWWNHGSSSRKKLSIWRPIVPPGFVYFGDIAVHGYEPPNNCIVLHDTRDDEFLRSPLDFQPVGHIKKQKGNENISFWMPQAPPGFVSLGCIACKGAPKQQDFSSLRCIRSDMVTGDQFLEENVWDTSGTKFRTEPFSIWTVGNELGTFVVRSGFKRPPKRFALKLADPTISGGSDDTVIDAVIGTFSAALFDDYGGLMVPLFNISLSGVAFSMHGRQDYLNSTLSFSISGRSYNDKYDSWEPLVEPVDGFLRYQYDLNAPGAASQLRITFTRDLNLNFTVSNANMIFQAYASWNNLSHAHESMQKRETSSLTYGGRSIIDTHQKRDYYIMPCNKLGQDIFIRATEAYGLSSILRMPSGDTKSVKVPVSDDMLGSHLKGTLHQELRSMVTIIITEAQLPRLEGLSLHQYTVAVRLIPNQDLCEMFDYLQSARTCGRISDDQSSELVLVKWNEIFFFKIHTLDYFMLEIMVTDIGKGDLVGYFSIPLKQMTGNVSDNLYSFDNINELPWIDLKSAESMMTVPDESKKPFGRIRCAVLLSSKTGSKKGKQSVVDGKKSGVIQISPSKEGPWTSVRFNYAAPAACWRLGNDVVASEVSVKDGNRFVNIRSLVSVRNTTDFTLDLCLELKSSGESIRPPIDPKEAEEIQVDNEEFETDDFFETETNDPTAGWVGIIVQPKHAYSENKESHQAYSGVELPSNWEWVGDWHLDTTSGNTEDGWVYGPNIESLKWPVSYSSSKFKNDARQRRWIRKRKQILHVNQEKISIGQLKPGEAIPLPLSGLTHSGLYILKFRPSNLDDSSEYSWSTVIDKPDLSESSDDGKNCSDICVSTLVEGEELLCCSRISGATSSNVSRGLWFCLTVQATEIAKDLHSDPIQDWLLVVKSPLSISNFLPLGAEYSLLERQAGGHFIDCIRGVFKPEEVVKIYNADIRKPLYLSLLPQHGWLPIHEAVLVSDPGKAPAKTISLRSSISGRVTQIILEQNHDKDQPILSKIIRVYAPYWFAVARCPPLTFRLIDLAGKNKTRKIALPFQSKKSNAVIFEEITEEEIYDGYTIASALNFKLLGLSVAITQSGTEQFGAVKDISPLGDMDGSLDLNAYDADGNCMQLFISSKPCPYPSVPTKVVSVRPFMTFTNRVGEKILLKMSSEDEPKVLHATDSRVSYVYRETGGTGKLQFRLENTEWSFPIEVVKEDTISLVLRQHDGTRRFMRIEIRGYEEGSRFIVVFRVGSTNGPIRIENRTKSMTIHIRQSKFGDDSWIKLNPLSTTNFSWEDPYGQRSIDAKLDIESTVVVDELNVENVGVCNVEGCIGLKFHVLDMIDYKIARFIDDRTLGSISNEGILCQTYDDNRENPNTQGNMQSDVSPLEIIIELGVVGLSVLDHRPKELGYLYFERVFISYSTGYDGGSTSRFKLILGHMQLDNQLPLTLMPVLLAPEQTPDMRHPVFKMTITRRNENPDGIQVYPYVYIRVTERCWRVNIHEPIIWAFVDFYSNLQLDRIPQSSDATQVDPEIRVDLIDVSEMRLKVSLETAPAQRPHGVLGVWSPILSAVGNAFKIQVHLRKVMHRDRFMRQSSIIPAIGNRIWRDLIHNPLHLIFSVDVLGMTSSTLASLSKGFAELSTDGQFLQLRSKQVWSRRITGVGDGIMQGTEALAQGFAFGVSGVVTKPVESARQNGLIGFAHGLGQAFLGIIVQPVSGALDFFSLTVDGIGASCTRCLEVFNNKTTFQRIRNPRTIRADGVLREYCEREAVGQMILCIAEASRNFGCTEIFKEPSKFAWSDYYEDHFVIPSQRIVLVTNKRVMLLQCMDLDKMDKKPSKIIWDVPWEELLALELAKVSSDRPSHLILHLKSFKRSEIFVRVIKCNVEEDSMERDPQAVRICSVVRKMWKAHQTDMKSLILKVPYSQWRDLHVKHQPSIKLRELSSSSSASDQRRFVKHSINFVKIWSSEQDSKGRCTLCQKQVRQDGGVCSIWRPVLPEGYVSIGDIAHVGSHPPNVAAVYRNTERLFSLPVGYDLTWRNCADDYITPVSIWHPRAPEGFVALGCVAVAGFEEPKPDLIFCVAESLAVETVFEQQKIWSSPDSYPWASHIYQIQSEALHFVALRQTKEDSDWKPMRVLDDPQQG